MTPDSLRWIAGIVGGFALLTVGLVSLGGPAALLKFVPAKNSDEADLHFVLSLANRLAAKGNADAVKLCQSLLDEMLKKP